MVRSLYNIAGKKVAIFYENAANHHNMIRIHDVVFNIPTADRVYDEAILIAVINNFHSYVTHELFIDGLVISDWLYSRCPNCFANLGIISFDEFDNAIIQF